jgi:hypothetical protein
MSSAEALGAVLRVARREKRPLGSRFFEFIFDFFFSE